MDYHGPPFSLLSLKLLSYFVPKQSTFPVDYVLAYCIQWKTPDHSFIHIITYHQII